MNSFGRYHFNPALRRKIEIIDLIIVLAILGITIIGLFNYNSFEGELRQGVETTGLIGLFLISFLVEFFPNVFNPYFGLMVAIATGFNVNISIFVACLGSLMGSVAGFEVGYRWGFRLVAALFEYSTLEKVSKFIENHGKVFLILAALTPLPFLPMVFGAFQISRREFWLYGIIPRMLGLIVLGYGFYQGISFL